MVLLDDVVQIFHLSQSRPTPQLTISLYRGSRFRIGRILVHSDGARVHCVRLRKNRFAASASRLAESRKSIVWPRLSTARYRYVQPPLTFT